MPTNLPKRHFSYTIKDFYKEYRNRKKEQGIPCSEILPYKVYRKILEKFFLGVSKKIIYENFTFMMPYSLGSILVKSHKTNLKNLKIDWSKSKEMGRIMKHLNLHTYGFYFMISWDKSSVRFRNSAYYLFTFTNSKKAVRQGVGKSGLSNHIKTLSKDPTKRSYIRI